jgi:hypothetical protein
MFDQMPQDVEDLRLDVDPLTPAGQRTRRRIQLEAAETKAGLAHRLAACSQSPACCIFRAFPLEVKR